MLQLSILLPTCVTQEVCPAKPLPPPAGIENSGAICFAISQVASLANTAGCGNRLCGAEHSKKCANPGCTVRQLEGVVRKLQQLRSCTARERWWGNLKTTAAVEALVRHVGMTPERQECTGEFFYLMHAQCEKVWPPPTPTCFQLAQIMGSDPLTVLNGSTLFGGQISDVLAER